MTNISRDQSGTPLTGEQGALRTRRRYETPIIDTYTEQEFQAELENTQPPSKPATGS